MKKRIDATSAALRFLVISAGVITAGVFLLLVGYILAKGVPNLKLSLFEMEYTTENHSLMPALINTLIMTALAILIATPIGVGSAIYLTEYTKKKNRLVGIIRLAAETLSGIPSIVYGLFGWLFFVNYLGWGYSILGGAMTITIMILPLILRTSEEALKSVPDTFRDGSFGLGAGRLRTVARVALPAAAPGILAGVILGIGRVVGETAALIYTSGTVAAIPDSVMSSGSTLAVHMYALSNEGLYVDETYATAVVLMVLVVGINLLSSAIAKRIAAPLR